MEESPVRQMFSGRSVFITGASGFIGRVLLEKLLRTYPEINKIYILMRVKRNMLPYDRLHKQLLKVPIFDQIKASPQGEELLNKIIVIPGDIAEPRLGISEDDMQMLLNDPTLSIVFHSAATIKFDEPLKVSVTLNLTATRTIIDMCKNLPNLVSLCHVSTAYANSDMKQNQDIEERIYPIKEKPEQLIKLAEILDDNAMQCLKTSFVGERPNTYTYTKALAEHLIASEAADLPVAIVRPSIVVASWQEPFPGWIDNINGPTGLVLAIGKGLLRSMHTIRNGKADIVPVDMTVNSMIAAAYYAAKTHGKLGPQTAICNGVSDTNRMTTKIGLKLEARNDENCNGIERSNGIRDLNEHKSTEMISNGIKATSEKHQSKEYSDQIIDEKSNISTKTSIETGNSTQQIVLNGNGVASDTVKKEPAIIHCVSGDIKPITWGAMEDMFFPIIHRYPSCQVLRYPSGSFKSNKYHDLITRIFVHYLPALIIDFLCLITGKKRQLLSAYYKLDCAITALNHFVTHSYNFKSKNLIKLRNELSEFDRRQLYMNIEDLDWLEFWRNYVLGARYRISLDKLMDCDIYELPLKSMASLSLTVSSLRHAFVV